eukprot:COSAG02_NODE_58686_length_276_cov_1.158192_1_plen_39_part_01
MPRPYDSEPEQQQEEIQWGVKCGAKIQPICVVMSCWQTV